MEFTVAFTSRQAKKLLLFLVCFELLLLVAYIVFFIFGRSILPWDLLSPLRSLLDFDGEVSIPTWFSSIQLFVVGVVLLLVARRNQKKEHLSSKFLAILGVGFILLSADEAATIHETLNKVVTNLNLEWLFIFKFKLGAWIILYSIIGVVFLLIFYRNFLSLWKHYRRESLAIGVGAIVYVVGVAGLEIVYYQYILADYVRLHHKIEVAAEEFLEMVGISIILYGFMLLAIRIAGNPQDFTSSISDRNE